MLPDHLHLEGLDIADRMAQEQGHTLHTDHDPGQVEGELHAYLVKRGRQVARDLPQILDQANDEQLARLGRADCIDQNPAADPALAPYLEMIAANLEQDQVPVQARPRGDSRIVPEGNRNRSSNALERGRVDQHRRSQPETQQGNQTEG